jgi:hypothetical protein
MHHPCSMNPYNPLTNAVFLDEIDLSESCLSNHIPKEYFNGRYTNPNLMYANELVATMGCGWPWQDRHQDQHNLSHSFLCLCIDTRWGCGGIWMQCCAVLGGAYYPEKGYRYKDEKGGLYTLPGGGWV